MNPSPFKTRIKKHYDEIGDTRRKWRDKNAYYHHSVLSYLRFVVPEGKRVLVLGSSTGDILASLNPSYGVGLDISGRMADLARKHYPEYEFIEADAEDPSSWGLRATFDMIVMPSLIGYLEHIQATLENLHLFCHPGTRIIIGYYNWLWEPILKLGERLHLKMPQKMQNWLSLEDIENLLYLADFETVKKERRLLVPKKIPLLHKAFECIGTLPCINKLCLCHFLVARPLARPQLNETSVTIVIPCRNERGNIEKAIRRLPRFGSSQEIIFVEGHSRDGTLDEIRRVIHGYPDMDVKYFVQKGLGKADAVRTGFENSSGDILMILDADLTVQPEDLPKFYHAIASGKGELINGSRLVYSIENQAMRLLNLFGNKFFSLMFSWLLNQRIKDTLCGTKVLSRENYLKLKEVRKYFGDFDPFGDFDLLFGASKLNLKIIEVPIRYRERTYGGTNISRFRHGWLLLKMTIFAYRKIKNI